MKKKTPNPQGKGLSILLDGLAQSRPQIPLPPKQIDQITSELFTSLFVLNSEFEFRPVVGKSYWLYRVEGNFKLYLLSPEDWSAGHPGEFIGQCVLQEDVTWTLALDEAMPAYIRSMPFYARLLAYGLGGSLRQSMQAAGINALGYDEARGLLAQMASD